MDKIHDALIAFTAILYAIAEYLFDDNGIHILTGYVVLIVIDVIIGTVKSAKISQLKSRTYLYGIFIKFLGICTVIIANVLDNVLVNYMQIKLGMDLSDTFACLLVGYEALSILENMYQMGIFTGKLQDTLSKIFDDKDLKHK
ncbi:phage holin family protein [Apilactobacillus sp. EABW-1NA]|uniref:phage holin family protein n=1 Tax=Apilactobacillus sp. EABW-1NA TaxID=2984137 RepID=UPI0025B0E2F5|nr:phage holin family protein [Apilactobacillus sp. EABW-1NA]MDN2612970.1 phage holin family protein [Apilactobacillus sp. EABW-1NA]